ncbi:TolB family protein [candidate division KSB1 bacterium]
MRITFTIALIAALILVSCNDPVTSEPGDEDTDALTGEYFGQTPPGATPVVFAPGIISLPDHFEHSAAVFSPDKRELFWASKPNGQSFFKLYYMKMENGILTKPAVAPFSGNFDVNRPVFSPDGNKLYYDMGSAIWVVEKQGHGWSEPARLPQVINSESGQIMHSITEDGSLYFTRLNSNYEIFEELEEIYVSRYINGQFAEPEKLDETINSDYARELAVFVAPDESYMIIEGTRDNSRAGLFISYKLNDNSWSERIDLNLGWGRFPCVSPDGNYLFYLGEEGIYWVNTSFIEDLRPDDLK